MLQGTQIQFTEPVIIDRAEHSFNQEYWSSLFSLPELDGTARVFHVWLIRRSMEDFRLHESLDMDRIPERMSKSPYFWSICLQVYDGLTLSKTAYPVIDWEPYMNCVNASWEWAIWNEKGSMGITGCTAFVVAAEIAHHVITRSDQYRNAPLFIQAIDAKRHQLFEQWVQPRLRFGITDIERIVYEDENYEDIYYTLLQM